MEQAHIGRLDQWKNLQPLYAYESYLDWAFLRMGGLKVGLPVDKKIFKIDFIELEITA